MYLVENESLLAHRDTSFKVSWHFNASFLKGFVSQEVSSNKWTSFDYRILNTRDASKTTNAF